MIYQSWVYPGTVLGSPASLFPSIPEESAWAPYSLSVCFEISPQILTVINLSTLAHRKSIFRHFLHSQWEVTHILRLLCISHFSSTFYSRGPGELFQLLCTQHTARQLHGLSQVPGLTCASSVWQFNTHVKIKSYSLHMYAESSKGIPKTNVQCVITEQSLMVLKCWKGQTFSYRKKW